MTPRIVAFSGPTIRPSRVQALWPECHCLGPAACGDVYRAARRGSSVIVLIDGYFEHRLSVWHKEILWALAQGVRVYGGGSMGALRAVELADHGMIGVGTVYELFRSGALEDDDEVAVAHADADHDYAAQSLAMVNVRATLRAALTEGVITSADEAQLVAVGKALYYPDRTFARVLKSQPELDPAKLAGLRDWLGVHGVVDQKHADAIALVARARDDAEKKSPLPLRGAQRFVHTSYWERFSSQFAEDRGAR
jgi:hypothetical protein